MYPLLALPPIHTVLAIHCLSPQLLATISPLPAAVCHLMHDHPSLSVLKSLWVNDMLAWPAVGHPASVQTGASASPGLLIPSDLTAAILPAFLALNSRQQLLFSAHFPVHLFVFRGPVLR